MMLCAIQFHYQFSLMTVKIYNKAIYRLLPLETHVIAAQKTVP